MWKYSNPVKIIFSDNFVEQLALIIGDNKKSNILVFSYEWFKNTDNYIRLKNVLGNFNFWGDIEENPSFTSCQKALDFTEELQPDIIIAIGGGSVIDTAKVVRMAIYKSCYDIQKLFTSSSKNVNKPLFIAVPTTHGTSSELTMWATIWNKADKKKYSLSEYQNYPDYAIYDYNLVESLPLNISLITTLDALSHAFESIWNKNANPISTNYAIHTIKLIVENIRNLNGIVSTDTRKNLMLASLYAGLAFSNTKTAAAHSISYPLTLYYNIPHGIACSITLPSLLEINKKCIEKEINSLLKILNVNSISEFWNIILKPVKSNIPFSLREYGIELKDIPYIISHSYQKDRIMNNIVNLNEKLIEKILREIY